MFSVENYEPILVVIFEIDPRCHRGVLILFAYQAYSVLQVWRIVTLLVSNHASQF